MTPEKQAVLTRLKRKIEVMHLDFRACNNTRYHDTAEMLLLIALLERNE